MSSALRWQGQDIPMRFSRRKTIALHVKDGAIEVRAPHQTSLRFAQQFLDSRSDWIAKALDEQLEQQRDKIDYSFAHRIPFMGIDVPVLRQQGRSTGWQLAEQGLDCTLTDLNDAEQMLAVMNDFYQRQAKFWLGKKTHALCERLELTERLLDIRFRRTKTKWGHCTAQGRIQYNWQIMMAPEQVIDYLVAHEVSHLQHMNHSTAFWQLVESVHPSYKQDRRWLRDQGHRLSIN